MHRLDVVGLATHFANIEDTLEHEFARTQLERFHRAVERATGLVGGEPPFVHAACSAASLLFRETDFTMARVGISMYGHWPSRETKLSWILEHGRGGLQLRPVRGLWADVDGVTRHGVGRDSGRVCRWLFAGLGQSGAGWSPGPGGARCRSDLHEHFHDRRDGYT